MHFVVSSAPSSEPTTTDLSGVCRFVGFVVVLQRNAGFCIVNIALFERVLLFPPRPTIAGYLPVMRQSIVMFATGMGSLKRPHNDAALSSPCTRPGNFEACVTLNEI